MEGKLGRRAFLGLAATGGVAAFLAACGVTADRSIPTPKPIEGKVQPPIESSFDAYSDNFYRFAELFENLDPEAIPQILEPEVQQMIAKNGNEPLLAVGDGENDGTIITADERLELQKLQTNNANLTLSDLTPMAVLLPMKRLPDSMRYMLSHIRAGASQERINCPEKLGHDWRLTLLILATIVGVGAAKKYGIGAELLAIGEHSYESAKFIDLVIRVPVDKLNAGLQMLGTNLEQMGLGNLAQFGQDFVHEGKGILFRVWAPTANSAKPGTAFFINQTDSFKEAIAFVEAKGQQAVNGFKNDLGTPIGKYLQARIAVAVARSLKALGRKGKECRLNRLVQAEPTPTAQPALDSQTLQQLQEMLQINPLLDVVQPVIYQNP